MVLAHMRKPNSLAVASSAVDLASMVLEQPGLGKGSSIPIHASARTSGVMFWS